MTNYKIIISGDQTLYTRKLVTESVPSQEAVVAQEYSILTGPAIEAKEAVPFKAAVWEYVPFSATFEYQNTDGYESGSSLFHAWIEEGSASSMTDIFNIQVEKEVETYTVSFNLMQTATLDAETVQEHLITDENEARDYVENNYYNLNYEEEGDVSDVEVEVDDTTFTDMEW